MGTAAAVRAGDALLSSRTDELWRECVARLDDDEPRHILADALQSENDPRGELMMLQLMPADPDSAPARRARISDLVRDHGDEWLGELVHIAAGASWDRGFLTRLELHDFDSKTWRKSGRHDAELATLQEVMPPQLMMGLGRREGHNIENFREVLTDQRLVSLRAIGGPSEVWPTLVQPIRHLVIDQNELEHQQRIALIASYLATHPHVRSLAFPIAFLPTARAWFDRLDTITVGAPIGRGLANLGELPRRATIVLGTRIALDTCDLRSPFDARLELSPQNTARVAGEWMLTSLDVLAELPERFTRLEIEDTSEAIVDRIRSVVGQRMEISLRGLVGRAANVRWR